MAVSKTTITGPVYLPNCDKPNDARIVFELSSWDREENEALIVSGPYVGYLDVNGDFSVELFSSNEGENDVVYRVSVSYIDQLGIYKREFLGTIGLSGDGPFKMADLEFITEWQPNSFDVIAQVASYKVQVEQAADGIVNEIEGFNTQVTNIASDVIEEIETLNNRVKRNLYDYDDLSLVPESEFIVGDYWNIIFGNTLLKVVTGSDFDIQLNNGVKLDRINNPTFIDIDELSATELSKYPDGTIGVMRQGYYIVDSTATGALSVTNNLGVDGILGYTDDTGLNPLSIINFSINENGHLILDRV